MVILKMFQRCFKEVGGKGSEFEKREEKNFLSRTKYILPSQDPGWEMVINNQEPCHHHQVYSDKLEESQGSMAELRHKIAGDVVIV